MKGHYYMPIFNAMVASVNGTGSGNATRMLQAKSCSDMVVAHVQHDRTAQWVKMSPGVLTEYIRWRTDAKTVGEIVDFNQNHEKLSRLSAYMASATACPTSRQWNYFCFHRNTKGALHAFVQQGCSLRGGFRNQFMSFTDRHGYGLVQHGLVEHFLLQL